MRSNFLADDLLKSVGDPKIAMILVKNGAGICKSAGFRLKKFISNNKELLMSIPEDQKRNGKNAIHYKSSLQAIRNCKPICVGGKAVA